MPAEMTMLKVTRNIKFIASLALKFITWKLMYVVTCRYMELDYIVDSYLFHIMYMIGLTLAIISMFLDPIVKIMFRESLDQILPLLVSLLSCAVGFLVPTFIALHDTLYISAYNVVSKLNLIMYLSFSMILIGLYIMIHLTKIDKLMKYLKGQNYEGREENV